MEVDQYSMKKNLSADFVINECCQALFQVLF